MTVVIQSRDTNWTRDVSFSVRCSVCAEHVQPDKAVRFEITKTGTDIICRDCLAWWFVSQVDYLPLDVIPWQ